MKSQSRVFFPALAATAFIGLALLLSRRLPETSAQTTGNLPAAPQPTAPVAVMPNGPHVVMDTSMGRITCQFFQKQAPIAVANFVGLATGTKDWTNPVTQQVEHNKPLYDGTAFHRVIPGFMIQGGGFAPGMQQKPTRKPVANEAANGVRNTRYTVAMARTSEPHSATAQFFINLADNAFLDYKGPSPQGYGYCVFGKVIRGSDVVDRIAGVPTGRSGFHENVPAQDVVITRAEVAG